MTLTIAPIVEGHGEVSAIPILLRRIGLELFGGCHINVLTPIRQPRGKLVTPSGTAGDGLTSAVDLARRKLAIHDKPRLVLLTIDSEGLCPKDVAPRLFQHMLPAPESIPQSVVLVHVMYETWFAAAAASLGSYLKTTTVPQDPEGDSLGKGWVKQHFAGESYSETIDQPAMTSLMDLASCQRTASFDKLIRELRKYLPT